MIRKVWFEMCDYSLFVDVTVSSCNLFRDCFYFTTTHSIWFLCKTFLCFIYNSLSICFQSCLLTVLSISFIHHLLFFCLDNQLLAEEERIYLTYDIHLHDLYEFYKYIFVIT